MESESEFPAGPIQQYFIDNRLTKLKDLGKGTFGCVWLTRKDPDPETGGKSQLRAIKIVLTDPAGDPDYEIKVYRDMDKEEKSTNPFRTRLLGALDDTPINYSDYLWLIRNIGDCPMKKVMSEELERLTSLVRTKKLIASALRAPGEVDLTDDDPESLRGLAAVRYEDIDDSYMFKVQFGPTGTLMSGGDPFALAILELDYASFGSMRVAPYDMHPTSLMADYFPHGFKESTKLRDTYLPLFPRIQGADRRIARKNLIFQICAGLYYLHHIPGYVFVHKDLKAQNVLVDMWEVGKVGFPIDETSKKEEVVYRYSGPKALITDFGISVFEPEGPQSLAFVAGGGTPFFRSYAAELFESSHIVRYRDLLKEAGKRSENVEEYQQTVGQERDIWELGMVVCGALMRGITMPAKNLLDVNTFELDGITELYRYDRRPGRTLSLKGDPDYLAFSTEYDELVADMAKRILTDRLMRTERAKDLISEYTEMLSVMVIICPFQEALGNGFVPAYELKAQKENRSVAASVLLDNWERISRLATRFAPGIYEQTGGAHRNIFEYLLGKVRDIHGDPAVDLLKTTFGWMPEDRRLVPTDRVEKGGFIREKILFAPYFDELKEDANPPAFAGRTSLGTTIDPTGEHEILYLNEDEAVIWNETKRSVYCDHVNVAEELIRFLENGSRESNLLCPRCYDSIE